MVDLEFQVGMKCVTLKVHCKTAAERDEMLKNIEQYTLGKSYINAYDPTIAGSFSHAKHVCGHGSLVEKFALIPHLLVDLMLKTTLFGVDVKDIKKEGRWPACFMGAMCWLAVFSYGMLEIAEQIHCNINSIPNSFLGITVCAVGTSFPNAIASILMAQQNKPAAAIANALGSNVQNVFLAMALPWVIYCNTQGITSIPQNVAGINEGVVWMAGTLVLVVCMVLVPPFCAMNYSYGLLLTLVYIVYLAITSAEAFHLMTPLMN
jgi:Ca2+/Na+ antiporter